MRPDLSIWLRTCKYGAVEDNERMADIYDAIRKLGAAEYGEIIAIVGGTHHEVVGKLRRLRRMGLICYDPPDWFAER